MNAIMASSYEHIGRYDVEAKHNRSSGGLDYYDVLISKDGNLIRNMEGCIGVGAVEYWKGYAIKILKRLNILYDRKDMVLHNLLCYSKSYLMDEPKEDYKKEWEASKDEAETIEIWIKDIEAVLKGEK